MTRSPREREPRPVPVRRYRYSKWRWRAIVAALDVLGGLAVRGRRALCAALREPESLEVRRVLVVQLDHLGDSVLTSPIFPELRALYPNARIDVLASPSNRAVFEADPLVDRVLIAEKSWFDRRPGRWSIAAVWDLGRRLRPEGYDLGIDVRGDILTVFVLALARIPRRLGWTMGGGAFLLTDAAEWQPGRHEVRSRLALLERLDPTLEGLEARSASRRVRVQVSDPDRARVAIKLREAWPAPTARRKPRRVAAAVPPRPNRSSATAQQPRPNRSSATAQQTRTSTVETTSAKPLSGDSGFDADWLHAGRFGSESPLLAVHLGAGTAAKRWPIRHWRALLARFLQDGWRVIVIGGPDDHGLAEQLDDHPNVCDWTGRLAVTETTALLERADLFLGADSGPAHLAACAGVPSVVLFSGTNRVGQWRPWSRRSLVIRHDVPCRPCHRKVCPLADHPCMTGIDPERVYRTVGRWWARLHRSEAPHAPL